MMSAVMHLVESVDSLSAPMSLTYPFGAEKQAFR